MNGVMDFDGSVRITIEANETSPEPGNTSPEKMPPRPKPKIKS